MSSIRQTFIMTKKFSLKWRDFQSTVSQSFELLRREKDLFDVTLVSDDEIQIPAHKLVLTASCDFFKKIFKRNTHSHPLLYLNGVDSVTFGSVLDFIYQGEAQMPQKDVNRFMEISEKWEINGLMTSGVDDTYETVSDKVEPIDKALNPKEDSESAEDEVKCWRERVITLQDVNTQIEELIVRREGKFYCYVCPYMTDHIGHIKEHVETHLEGLLYQCPDCPRTFRTSGAVRKHFRKCHYKKSKQFVEKNEGV